MHAEPTDRTPAATVAVDGGAEGGSALRRRARSGLGIVGAMVLALLVLGPVSRPAAASTRAAEARRAAQEQQRVNTLNAPKAVVLGLVEGITEFLPISSTGHLLVTDRLLDVGQTSADKDAADTYAVAIQLGAILAVLVLYRKRIGTLFEGLIGRDEQGRGILASIVVAFLPAAVIGAAFDHSIKAHLFGTWPVLAAWVIGGVVILIFARNPRFKPGHPGLSIEALSIRAALIIGLAQVLSLWPGTSRSLVTLLAGLVVGLTLSAAVEFTFLLGLLTLTAATVFELAKNGDILFKAYGWVNPLIGFLVAFVAALVAIKWMIEYLKRHDLAIFGYYRLGVAALVAVLLVTNVI